MAMRPQRKIIANRFSTMHNGKGLVLCTKRQPLALVLSIILHMRILNPTEYILNGAYLS